MKAADIQLAVSQLEADPMTDATSEDLDEALRRVLPLLRQLTSNIPWWKKLIIGIKALIGAIEAYLGDGS